LKPKAVASGRLGLKILAARRQGGPTHNYKANIKFLKEINKIKKKVEKRCN
jgi:hypothetical protein